MGDFRAPACYGGFTSPTVFYTTLVATGICLFTYVLSPFLSSTLSVPHGSVVRGATNAVAAGAGKS